MPLPTYILIQLSNGTHKYGLFVAAIVGIFFGCFIYTIRQPAGRRWWDETKLRLPLMGRLMQDSFFAQFCQTMSNLLQNGLPLLTSLKLMSRATGNVFYTAQLIRITELVGEGASLTRAMKAVGHFPAILRDLVKVGEQTGDLGVTMEKIGERYDKEIKRSIDGIMTVVPLIVISGLGLMVFLIAWSMLSGIFAAMHGIQAGHH